VKLFKAHLGKLIFCGAAVLAVVSSMQLSVLARAPADEGISHVMPGVVNVFMGLGDRYLVANLLVINSIVSIGEGDIHFKDKSQLQLQAVYLNGYNEDNYYQASASLPWNGFVDEGQQILRQARRVRDFDPWPAFYEGFSEFYFYKNYTRAAELSLMAADRSVGSNRRLFKDLAANWLTSGANYKLALTMVTELERNTKSLATKKRLNGRKQRLTNLIMLEELVSEYNRQFSRWPINLSDLVEIGLLEEIPRDPWGRQYVLTESGSKVGMTKK
jgi:hypothetical protein